MEVCICASCLDLAGCDATLVCIRYSTTIVVPIRYGMIWSFKTAWSPVSVHKVRGGGGQRQTRQKDVSLRPSKAYGLGSKVYPICSVPTEGLLWQESLNF